MAEVEVRGVLHYYEWVRQSDAVNKPVMIFVHGWGGSSQYWRSTAAVFSEDFDCLLYDLRGFGRSPLPTDYEGHYTLEDYVLDLVALLDALQIGTDVVLNAHSMGASIAALFAEQQPQFVRRLILNCNGVFTYDEQAFAIFQKIGGEIVKWRFPWLKHIPLMDRFAMARFLYRPIPSGDRRQFLLDFLSADDRAAAGTLIGSVNQEMVSRIPAAFTNIQCPTLFLSGEKDKIIPATMARQAIALNPQFQYIEIPHVGHFPMLENPDIYHEKIREFLRH